MQPKSVQELLQGNAYPGRGIIIGMTPDGKRAASAYFIMGRSANSRNRIFREQDGIVSTFPFDASKVEDPSLIIYPAVRSFHNQIIVTNGDQTDTIFEALADGKTFEAALAQRRFEPDGPNWTPRISGLLSFGEESFTYQLSILKAADGAATACNRFYYSFESIPGVGHLIHTYDRDGDPLPSFSGEPKGVLICDDIDVFTQEIWNSLDENNKISLYVRYTDLVTGRETSRMYNKNTGGAK